MTMTQLCERLDVQVHRGARDTTVIEARGELDFDTARRLRSALLPAVEHGTVVLDVRQVSFFDCGALHLLLEATRRAHRHGAAFRLAAPSDRVDRLIRLAGADSTLEVFSDLKTALAP
jgi:anti-sigma B factor antagonist